MDHRVSHSVCNSLSSLRMLLGSGNLGSFLTFEGAYHGGEMTGALSLDMQCYFVEVTSLQGRQ